MSNASLEYSTNKEKNDYIKLIKSKATNMTDPELKERILKSLKQKSKNVINK